MKNTTFRKKALLSSVAMLLVALVALGSATFAWFTQNKTVTAEGLVLNATTSAGLQILSGSVEKNGGDWDTKTILNATKNGDDIIADKTPVTLGEPLSLDQQSATSKFYTTLAAVESSHERGDAAITQVTTFTGIAYEEDIKVRSSIDTEEGVVVKDVAVTIDNTGVTGSALSPAVRVTILDAANNVIGTWGLAKPANDYISEGAVVTNTAAWEKGYESAAAATLNKTVKYEGYSYKMIVWLDGEDESCYTHNVPNLKDLVKSITVTFTAQ